MEGMEGKTGQFVVWALLIIGAGVAVVLYQHTLHTGLVLQTLSGQTPAGAPQGLFARLATSASVAWSRFTGVWSPTGPDQVSQFAQPMANPNAPIPFVYGWGTTIGDNILPFEFPLVGPVAPTIGSGQTLH